MKVRWLIAYVLLVNAASMLTPIINEGDSVTYAALSQHIANHNHWGNLMLDGQDWLDKPHFPFWITALFFKLGGISAFTYILPGYLFHLLGAYFSYRIARLFYGRDAALLTLLVYVSAYHLMYTSSAIKAEAFLTGSITGACYCWLRFDANARLKYLLLGALFSAISVMTKGIFTLITIGSGMVCMWAFQRHWERLWQGKWVLAIAVTVLFLTPELVSLFLQFDLHPEKTVFGQTHVSGIRFFLWDSQFGRFFNSGPIKNQGGSPLYYLHVFLWAFLPWVGIFLATLVAGARGWASMPADEQAKLVFLGGAFAVTFVLFSATQFQLDYYTVILYPFAAILCGPYLRQWLAQEANVRWLAWMQIAIAVLVYVLTMGMGIYVGNGWLFLIIVLPVLLIAMPMARALGLFAKFRTNKLKTKKTDFAVLVLPVLATTSLYAFLEGATYLAYSNYGVAYNVSKLMEGRQETLVVAYQLDDIVAREISLYRGRPCVAASDATQLPPATSGLYVVAKASQMPELKIAYGTSEVMAQGQWVDHKTGLLPRLLRLAKGTEPLETFNLIKVVTQPRSGGSI